MRLNIPLPTLATPESASHAAFVVAAFAAAEFVVAAAFGVAARVGGIFLGETSKLSSASLTRGESTLKHKRFNSDKMLFASCGEMNE